MDLRKVGIKNSLVDLGFMQSSHACNSNGEAFEARVLFGSRGFGFSLSEGVTYKVFVRVYLWNWHLVANIGKRGTVREILNKIDDFFQPRWKRRARVAFERLSTLDVDCFTAEDIAYIHQCSVHHAERVLAIGVRKGLVSQTQKATYRMNFDEEAS